MRLFLSSLSSSNEAPPVQQSVKFAYVTDVHYGDINNYGSEPRVKNCRDGLIKMQKAVDHFKTMDDIDFAFQGGDLTDMGYSWYVDGPLPSDEQSFEDLADVCDVWKQIDHVPRYNLLGNHDLDRFTKAEYMENTGQAEAFYYFDIGRFRFICLDPNYSYYTDDSSFEAGSMEPVPGMEYSWVNPSQIQWLSDLIDASQDKAVIMMSHQPFHEISPSDTAEIGNRVQIRGIVERYGNVLCCINGHVHTNQLEAINGIEYINMDAVTTDPYPLARRATIEISATNLITVTGWDGQADYSLQQ